MIGRLEANCSTLHLFNSDTVGSLLGYNYKLPTIFAVYSSQSPLLPPHTRLSFHLHLKLILSTYDLEIATNSALGTIISTIGIAVASTGGSDKAAASSAPVPVSDDKTITGETPEEEDL